MALAVAGDDEVEALRKAPLREHGRGHTLRAVTGASEGDQQRRCILGEALPRVRDDVGRGRHVDAAAEAASQRGSQDLAGEGRRPRAGEKDPQVRASQEGRQERVGLLSTAHDLGADFLPQRRLLGDLPASRGRATRVEVGWSEADRRVHFTIPSMVAAGRQARA